MEFFKIKKSKKRPIHSPQKISLFILLTLMKSFGLVHRFSEQISKNAYVPTFLTMFACRQSELHYKVSQWAEGPQGIIIITMLAWRAFPGPHSGLCLPKMFHSKARELENACFYYKIVLSVFT